jgi:exonuclease SbcD
MPKILHFADAHIDIANHGRHDPQTGLAVRVLDFLKSLDTIVDTAIDERVDLVIFAGDAYRDRTPAPTFQREWGRRIMRLSAAGIPTLLLVGNHDLSPAYGRAHALEEFSTLQVPHVRVLDRPAFYGPQDLEGLPLQLIAIPWIARAGLMAYLGMSAADPTRIYTEMEDRLATLVQDWLEEADPDLPVILTAHCSVQGAKYGGERSVMLGGDLVLSGSLVRHPRLDYVALGHIHKPQDLNLNGHPPIIYPGSIERVDFGEAHEKKYFIIADVTRGQTRVEWRELTGVRPFYEFFLRLDPADGDFAIPERMRKALPAPEQLAGAVVRFEIEYPREWEPMIDETILRPHIAAALEFRLAKRPQSAVRLRLPAGQVITSMTPLDLLGQYWDGLHFDGAERDSLQQLAASVIQGVVE